jgi:hypothetical protein
MDTLISALKDIGEKRWITRVLLPSILFISGLTLIYLEILVGWNNIILWWRSYPIEGQIILIGEYMLACLLTAAALDFSRDAILELASGNVWRLAPFRWLWKRGTRLHRARFQQLNEKYNKLANKGGNATDLEYAELVELEESLRHYPVTKKRIQPTSIGNALYAAADYAEIRYGLDLRATWTVIQPLMSDQLREDLTSSRLSLDLDLRLVLLLTMFSVAQIIASIYLMQIGRGIAVLAISLIAIYTIYNWAISAARDCGEQIRAVYSLHRFQLYSNLHLPWPTQSGEDEREAGQMLTEHLWRGTVNICYTTPSEDKTIAEKSKNQEE